MTGSNQGIGLGFVKALLGRGAKRVYATARREESLPALVALVVLDPQRIEPLLLDVNDAAQRQRAAAQATDVTWLWIRNSNHLPRPSRFVEPALW